MQKTNAVPVTILCIAPILILATVILSILYGAKSIDAETVWNALFHFDSSDVNHNIIITSRLPRVVAALLVRSISSHIRSTYAGDDKKLSCIPFYYGCDGWCTLLLHYV